MFHDINTAVETLVGDWGTPTMPFEHELFLYHFQTWIYFPKPVSVELSLNLGDVKGQAAAV